MRIITDADVAASVVAFLRERGHDVQESRDILLPDSPDPLIAKTASAQNAVVVTWNRRDFLALAKRRAGPQQRYTYAGMHLITFDGLTHIEGLSRLRDVIEEIEFMYGARVERRGQRLIAIVGQTYLKYEDLT